MTYKIPFLRKEGNTVKISSENIKFINLPNLHLPICITSAIIILEGKDKNKLPEKKIIVDPNVSFIIIMVILVK